MTPKQIAIIENSWDFILLEPLEAGSVFYAKLFELDPDLRRLFNVDLTSQSAKLISMITFVVHKLNFLDDLLCDVHALGVRHKKYNVKPEHFETVEVALLWTLQTKLGNLWDEDTRDAWRSMYNILSKSMMEANYSEREVSK